MQLLIPLLPLIEALLVLGLIGVMFRLLVPQLRATPIKHLLSFRRFGRAETTTPFHTYGFVLLGLGALGDAAGGYQVLGSTPWFVGALLGALMGLLPQRLREKAAFLPLGVLALSTTAYDLLIDATVAERTFAAAVLTPMVLGVVMGFLPPFAELRPTVVLGKLCATAALANFAVNNPAFAGAALNIDHGPVVITVVVAVAAGLLLVLPGAGIALLLGLAISLFGFYYGLRKPGPATDFTMAFLVLWAVAAVVRGRLVLQP